LNNLVAPLLSCSQKNSEEILKIVGPSAANFAQQEGEFQDEIKKQNGIIEEEINKRALILSQMQMASNLIHVLTEQISGKDSALNETKSRQQHLQTLKEQGDQAINNIPKTNTQTVTETTNHNRGWWWWRRHWTTTSTKQVQVPNPNRDAEVNYYNGIINSREARRKEELKEQESIEEKKNSLILQKMNYQKEYDALKSKFEETTPVWQKNIAMAEQKIKDCVKKIEDIRKLADQTENDFGMKGSALLQCLSSIRNFAKADQRALKLWQPLITVLEGVKELVETPLMLLEKDGTSVFIAGIRLVKTVQLFHGAVHYLRQETTDQKYVAIQDKIKVQLAIKNK